MSMFRRAILNAARTPPRTLGRIACPTLSRPVAPLVFRSQRAWYSAPSALSRQDITDRIIDTLKGFEKVPQEKLTTTSHFGNDLGLDSLDAVEVVMAIEEEFGVEIPDEEADGIQTVKQAIEYIEKTPDAV